MFTRAEIKAQAKQQLKGNVWMLFLCTLIYMAITMALAFIPVAGVIAVYIVAPAFVLGLTMVYLDVTYGDKVDIATLFKGFNRLGQAILLCLVSFLSISFKFP